MTEERSGHSSCLVVGYDGSPPAAHALAYAARRTGRQGKLVVVTATGAPSDWLVAPTVLELLSDHARRAGAVQDAMLMTGPADLLDCDLETELAEGSPARALAAAGRRWEADEIVVGSRGLGRARAALGSVSHELLHLADRPVTVVPEPR